MDETEYHRIVGKLATLHNELSVMFSMIAYFFLNIDDKRISDVLLSQYRHLDQKISLIDKIYEYGDKEKFISRYWCRIKNTGNALNNKRGRIIHGAVVNLINDATGERKILLSKPDYTRPFLFTERQIEDSLSGEQLHDLVEKYTNLYLFVSYVVQGYCLTRSGVAQWHDPEMHKKYRDSIAKMENFLEKAEVGRT